jgi:hypothetical protein
MEDPRVEGAVYCDDMAAPGEETNNDQDSSGPEHVDPTRSASHVVLMGDEHNRAGMRLCGL